MNNCGFRFETIYFTAKQFFTEHSTDYVISPDTVLVNNTLAKSMGLDFLV